MNWGGRRVVIIICIEFTTRRKVVLFCLNLSKRDAIIYACVHPPWTDLVACFYNHHASRKVFRTYSFASLWLAYTGRYRLLKNRVKFSVLIIFSSCRLVRIKQLNSILSCSSCNVTCVMMSDFSRYVCPKGSSGLSGKNRLFMELCFKYCTFQIIISGYCSPLIVWRKIAYIHA